MNRKKQVIGDDRLQVSTEDVIDEVERLDRAIATYRELGEKPLQGSLGTLSQMHSNFVARLERMLESLDDKNVELLEMLDYISVSANDIVGNLRQLDVEMTRSMDMEGENDE